MNKIKLAGYFGNLKKKPTPPAPKDWVPPSKTNKMKNVRKPRKVAKKAKKYA